MADYVRGERLRALREAAHLSQETLAYEIGVSTKSVRTWEKGGRIRWHNAKSLGVFFGEDPEQLVSREFAAPATVNDPPEVPAQLTELVEELRLLQAQLAARDAEVLARIEEVHRSIQGLRG